MAAHPVRSEGVLTAPLGELTVLYDLATEHVHLLDPVAGFLWESSDGTHTVGDLAAELAAAGADPDRAGAEVARGLAALRGAGLIDREPAVGEPSRSAQQQVRGRLRSRTFAVLDDGVVVRCDDQGLIDRVDALLRTQATLRRSTVELGAEVLADGSAELSGLGPPRMYASAEALIHALPTALNQIAAASSSCLALHAGGVRSPLGEVIALPAVSGAGKTTLTGALVRAGWAYASDEAVGVRESSLDLVPYPKPLVLDRHSRKLLGVEGGSDNVDPTRLHAGVDVLVDDTGPIDRVVLPSYDPAAAVSLSEPLEPREAIVAVLQHALNLRFVGEPGLRTLCELAERVPVQRLVHGGVYEASRVLASV